MAIEIIMPKLGVDMQEGEIIEWKKQEGDFVNEGDVILEMMSDKTSMELEAEESGVLLKIVHGNGATVPVTEVIAYLGAEGETVEAVGEPVELTPSYFVFRKDSAELQAKVNKALQELKADGTLAKISEKWFGKDYTK